MSEHGMRDDKPKATILVTSNNRWETYFSYKHLPPPLQNVSKPFCMVALMVLKWPQEPEREECLRHLLLAKDAAVRNALEVPCEKEPNPPPKEERSRLVVL